MKNFHVPLPAEIHAQLKARAAAERTPATALAREAIEAWLKEEARRSRRDALAEYAQAMAGTSFDLDPELEAAAVAQLRGGRKR